MESKAPRYLHEHILIKQLCCPFFVILIAVGTLFLAACNDMTWGEKAREFDDVVRVTFTVPLGMDFDVDADNNGVIDDADEDVEDTDGEPSQIFQGSFDDLDYDGIPDFAGGFGRFEGDTDDIISCTEARFAVAIVKVAEGADIGAIRVKFRYEASDPSGVTRTGSAEDGWEYHLPDTAPLRLWRKDMHEARDRRAISQGGDWARPDEAFEFTKLGIYEIDNDPLTRKIYVEGLQTGQARIECAISFDGGTTWDDNNADACRVTVIHFDVDVDSNRTGQVDRTLAEDNVEFGNDPIDYLSGKGALLKANTDRDENGPDHDCANSTITNAADLKDIATIIFNKINLVSVPQNATIKFELSISDPHTEYPPETRVRIFDKREAGGLEIMGKARGREISFTAGGQNDINELIGNGERIFGAEGIEYGCEVTLIGKFMIGNNLIAEDKVRMLVAPFIVMPNTALTEKVFVVRYPLNQVSRLKRQALRNFYVKLKTALKGSLVEVNGSIYLDGNRASAPWLQDVMEIGTTNSTNVIGNSVTIADLPYDRKLGEYPYDLWKSQRDFGYRFMPGNDVSPNHGGNIECAPPTKDFPLGRIVVGSSMDNDIKKFFKRQRVQTAGGTA